MICDIHHSELPATDNFSILSCMDEKEIDKRVKALDKVRGENLRRLRNRKGWSQGELAQRTKMEQSKISAYENGLGFDKTTLVRFCEVFKVKTWEFEWEESVPVIIDPQEIEDIKQRREAEKVGIADMVREAEESWIKAAKKKEGPGGKGKAGWVPRRSAKRA